MADREDTYDEMVAWLLKWGSFINHEELATYSWSLTDVVAIMQEWAEAYEQEDKNG